ncbi:MAG: YraN family protein [Mangrovicoccus sp.]|nr:YraN family protein [Mangrovicoccus sp.]
MSGLVSHCAGLSAEAAVAAHYGAAGAIVLARRWRGGGGEIDLILDQAGCIVFVEVKQAGNFDRAAARVSPAQRARLFAAAEVFLGSLPGGAPRDCRFDVALVDGTGRTRIVENAFL